VLDGHARRIARPGTEQSDEHQSREIKAAGSDVSLFPVDDDPLITIVEEVPGAGRERLLALYGRSLPLHLAEAETRDVVERTEGVTASFLKELLRRAMLESLHDQPHQPTVTAEHVSRALDDLLDSTQQLTRSLLGVGNDRETLPAGGGLGALPPRSGRGWMVAQARARSRRIGP
jgi:hypothetical protein